MAAQASFWGKYFWILFGAIWTAVGLPFLAVGLYSVQQELRLDREAVSTDGLVLARDVGRGKNAQYSVAYRFTTAEGEIVEGRDKVGVQLWQSLEVQGPVQIEYLAADPGSNRVAGNADWTLAILFTGLGGAFSIAGSIILLIGIRKLRRRSFLLSRGMIGHGAVTQVGPTNVRINSVTQWRVHYRYLDHMGMQREGRSEYMAPDEAQRWSEGDRGEIRYHPDKPEQSLWLG